MYNTLKFHTFILIDMANQPSRQKLKVISGTVGGELESGFEEFAKGHEIIDWNVTQDSLSPTWVLFIRYKG